MATTTGVDRTVQGRVLSAADDLAERRPDGWDARVDRERARPLAATARDGGVSHAHTLDGTHLATFRREDPTHPSPEDR